MLDFIKKLFQPRFSPGSIPDPRNYAQKALDFQHEELASAFAAPTWGVKNPVDWAKFSIRNQDGSSSCVGQGIAKAFEMHYGEPFSARPIYFNRRNYPSAGMWLQDGGDIAKKIGTVPEKLLPSQFLNESQMNLPVDMGQFKSEDIKKAKAYIFINPKDIDAIAQVLDAGYPVILTFESNYQEWTSIPKYYGTPIKWGHCVCDPKDRTLWTDANYTNMKAIVIDESWGVGINTDGVLPVDGKRLITEDFLKNRATGAMYLIFDDGVTTTKPNHRFESNLSINMNLKNDADVKALQAILSYEKDVNGNSLFTTDPSFHTGNFGNMTKNAVMKLQALHSTEILAPAGLLYPTGTVGFYTREYLNRVYSI